MKNHTGIQGIQHLYLPDGSIIYGVPTHSDGMALQAAPEFAWSLAHPQVFQHPQVSGHSSASSSTAPSTPTEEKPHLLYSDGHKAILFHQDDKQQIVFSDKFDKLPGLFATDKQDQKPLLFAGLDVRDSPPLYTTTDNKPLSVIFPGDPPLGHSPAPPRSPKKSKSGGGGSAANGERPYKCLDCEYATGRKDHLKKHLLTHTEAKPFKCAECAYVTRRNDHLQKHLLIHSGEKPYKCGACDYKSGRKDHVKKHMLTHSEEKPYKCPQCEYRCRQRSVLQKHRKTHRSHEQNQHQPSTMPLTTPSQSHSDPPLNVMCY